MYLQCGNKFHFPVNVSTFSYGCCLKSCGRVNLCVKLCMRKITNNIDNYNNKDPRKLNLYNLPAGTRIWRWKMSLRETNKNQKWLQSIRCIGIVIYQQFIKIAAVYWCARVDGRFLHSAVWNTLHFNLIIINNCSLWFRCKNRFYT